MQSVSYAVHVHVLALGYNAVRIARHKLLLVTDNHYYFVETVYYILCNKHLCTVLEFVHSQVVIISKPN